MKIFIYLCIVMCPYHDWMSMSRNCKQMDYEGNIT